MRLTAVPEEPTIGCIIPPFHKLEPRSVALPRMCLQDLSTIFGLEEVVPPHSAQPWRGYKLTDPTELAPHLKAKWPNHYMQQALRCKPVFKKGDIIIPDGRVFKRVLNVEKGYLQNVQFGKLSFIMCSHGEGRIKASALLRLQIFTREEVDSFDDKTMVHQIWVDSKAGKWQTSDDAPAADTTRFVQFRLSQPIVLYLASIQAEGRLVQSKGSAGATYQHTLDSTNGNNVQSWASVSPTVGLQNRIENRLQQFFVTGSMYFESMILASGAPPTPEQLHIPKYNEAPIMGYISQTHNVVSELQNAYTSSSMPKGELLKTLLSNDWLTGVLPNEADPNIHTRGPHLDTYNGIIKNIIRNMSFQVEVEKTKETFMPVAGVINTSYVPGLGFVAISDIYDDTYLVLDTGDLAMKEEKYVNLKVRKIAQESPSCNKTDRVLGEHPGKLASNYAVPSTRVCYSAMSM
jgi:hypothetical protein